MEKRKTMETLCKSLLIASLAVIVLVGSAGAADVSYGEDEQYTNATQDTSVVVNQDSGAEVGNWEPTPTPPNEIPEFSTIVIPVASILGLLFFFSYRKRRGE